MLLFVSFMNNIQFNDLIEVHAISIALGTAEFPPDSNHVFDEKVNRSFLLSRPSFPFISLSLSLSLFLSLSLSLSLALSLSLSLARSLYRCISISISLFSSFFLFF